MSPPHKHCLVLQHVPSEGPEHLGLLLQAAGFSVEIVPLHAGAPVPASLPDDLPLVVMGGSMGVADVGDPAHPYLAAEVALLRARLAVGAPVLGICLGSQLVAHAAGARVYPATRRPAEGAEPQRVYEVGWAPVDFLGVDREPALAGLRPREMMLHWHGDTFDLPPGAVHLASTPVCPHQAFRVGRAFGVQFHPELGLPTIEEWLRADADYVARATGPDGAARIRSDTARYFPEYRAVGDRLLRNLIGCLG